MPYSKIVNLFVLQLCSFVNFSAYRNLIATTKQFGRAKEDSLLQYYNIHALELQYYKQN